MTTRYQMSYHSLKHCRAAADPIHGLTIATGHLVLMPQQADNGHSNGCDGVAVAKVIIGTKTHFAKVQF